MVAKEFGVKETNASLSNIPVMIDDIKQIKEFYMTRCCYFTIECDIPSSGWELLLRDNSIPFYLFNISGIVVSPIGNVSFENVTQINELFDVIDKHDELYIDTNDIWLPNFFFESQALRGDLYRVDEKLFVQAYLFGENRITQETFLASCKELDTLIYFSKIETLAFKEFEKKTIKEAKTSYPKNKELELSWEENKQSR